MGQSGHSGLRSGIMILGIRLIALNLGRHP